jgi:hypothetical protein
LADKYDLGFRKISPQDAGGLESAHSRHGYVHQDNIGSQGLRRLNGLESVRGLAANLPLRARGKQGAKTSPYDLVIVHNEYLASY